VQIKALETLIVERDQEIRRLNEELTADQNKNAQDLKFKQEYKKRPYNERAWETEYHKLEQSESFYNWFGVISNMISDGKTLSSIEDSLIKYFQDAKLISPSPGYKDEFYHTDKGLFFRELYIQDNKGIFD